MQRPAAIVTRSVAPLAAANGPDTRTAELPERPAGGISRRAPHHRRLPATADCQPSRPYAARLSAAGGGTREKSRTEGRVSVGRAEGSAGELPHFLARGPENRCKRLRRQELRHTIQTDDLIRSIINNGEKFSGSPTIGFGTAREE
jgi:hypothetical protein